MLNSGVSVTKACADDAYELAPILRAQDIAEIEALAPGRSHANVIARSVEASQRAWAFRVGGRLALVGGVAAETLLGNTGVPWLLGSDVATRHARALMRVYPTYIGVMFGLYDELENIVHLKNTISVGWLRRMGFEFGEAFTTPAGEPFARFRMKKPCAIQHS